MVTDASTDAPAASPLFTCQACSIAYRTADEQRSHYRSDHHRYNMQRRVAGLAPLNAEDYNSKVLEHRADAAAAEQHKDWNCLACRKSYTTENAYLSHLNSKRHKENEAKPMFQRAPSAITSTQTESTMEVPEDADEETVNAIIDARIESAAAASQLSPTTCLFCPAKSNDVASNFDHMRSAHSFHPPSSEHLVDPDGFMLMLAGKVAVARICIYCAREFRTVDAVRKHMVDKSHSKVPFETRGDRRELAAFYDIPRPSAAQPPDSNTSTATVNTDDDWVDVAEPDGINAEDPPQSESEDSEDADLGELNDNPFEMTLRGGQRIGHRSLARYYKQRFTPLPASASRTEPKPTVKEILGDDKNSALVPASGAGFGGSREVIKARNAGEARHAYQHVVQHRDQRRREEFRTRVAFLANHQKHYRDPLLGKIGS